MVAVPPPFVFVSVEKKKIHTSPSWLKVCCPHCECRPSPRHARQNNSSIIHVMPSSDSRRDQSFWMRSSRAANSSSSPPFRSFPDATKGENEADKQTTETAWSALLLLFGLCSVPSSPREKERVRQAQTHATRRKGMGGGGKCGSGATE